MKQGGYKLSQKDQQAIGIDIGGTKIKTAITDVTGKILSEDERPTPAQDGAEAIVAAAAESALAVLTQRAEQQTVSVEEVRQTIAVVGVGVPGVVDDKTGVALRAGNLAGWRNVPLRAELQRRLDLPVRLTNDVRAGAYAEWRWGAGGGEASPFLYFNVGTGIAVSLIVDGHIYEGANNAAGEFGHSVLDPHADVVCAGCGKRGDVESLVAGPALSRAYARAAQERGLEPETPQAADVLQRAESGEPLASEVLERYIFYLGLALGNVTTIFNPQVIVLGGGLGTAERLPLDKVRDVARQYAYEHSWQAVTVTQARLGSAAGAIGAAGWALSRHG